MKTKTGILSKIYIAILLIFLYSPIAVLIFYSFNNGKTTVWKGFTFKWYVQLFRDDNIMNALWNTVIIAVLASVFATILGTAAAIGISNFKGKKRMLIQNASNIPIISPDIVMGVSLMGIPQKASHFAAGFTLSLRQMRAETEGEGSLPTLRSYQ